MRVVLSLSLGERTMAKRGGRGGEEWAGEAVASITSIKGFCELGGTLNDESGFFDRGWAFLQ